MSADDILNKIPAEGFVKVVHPEPSLAIDSGSKAALIRKANTLFNEGQVEMASKIFLTLNYTDGIVRLGDFYYNKNDYVKALALFKTAKDEGRIEKTSLKMAEILRNWLDE